MSTLSDRAQLHAACMSDMAMRATTEDERAACEVARAWFELQASRYRAIENGKAVRIEIPIVVGPRGYFVDEVDTIWDPNRKPADPRVRAASMSRDQTYEGTPYVATVVLPAHKPAEVDSVIGEVTPC